MFIEAVSAASIFFLTFDPYLNESKWRQKEEKSRLCA